MNSKSQERISELVKRIASRVQGGAGDTLWNISRGLFTRGAARAALVLLLIAFTGAAYFGPEYNWDLFAYIGCAVETEFRSVAALHAFVFETVQQAVEPEGWSKLIHGGSRWRESAYSSPQVFGSVLDFYRVKVLFVAAIGLLGKVMNIAHAPFLIGWLFGILSLLTVYTALVRLDMERFFVLAVPIILGANLQWLCRLPTPDSMSCFFLLAGVYAYVFKSRLLAHIIFASAVLARPDSLAFVAALVLVQIVRRDISLAELAAASASPVCYLLATRLTGHPGWWPHFYYTHLEYIDMTGFSVPMQFRLYLDVLARELPKVLMKYGWMHMYLALLVGYAGLNLRRDKSADVWDAMVLSTLVALAARAFIFPHMTGRIMCAYVLIAGFALAGRAAASFPGLVGKGPGSGRR